MADREYIQRSKGQGKTVTNLKKFGLLEATVSKDDTITVADLVTIDSAKIVTEDTAADVDCTFDDNIITITEDPCVNKKVVVLVVGE